MAALEFQVISIQGFRSFCQRQVMRLQQPAGLAYMTGKNLVFPEKGPNAVGKSSLWDALVWVLYGKTTSGLKAGAVHGWKCEKQCRIFLKFKKDGQVYRLIRTWSPNALFIESGEASQDIDQTELDKILGLSFDEFCHSVVLSQFGQMFLDMVPSDKTELLSRVLQLGVWDGFSEKAALVADEAELELGSLQEQESGISGQLEGLSIVDLRAQAREWERSKKQQVDVASKEVTDLEAKQVVLTAELAEVQTIAAKLKVVLDKGISKIGALAARAKRLQLLVGKRDRLLAVLEERCSRIEASLDALHSLESGSGACPTCGQDVDAKHLRDERRQLSAELRATSAEKESVEHSRTGLVRRLGKVQASYDSGVEHQSELRARYDRARTKYAELAQTRKHLRHEIFEKRSLAEKGEAQRNPFAVLLHQAEKKAGRYTEALVDIGRMKGKWQQRQSSGEFWTKEFRSIKLFILEAVFQHLEVEVNDVLERLGLSGWAVRFNTDKVSASGNVRKMFSTEIYVPGRKKAIPWEVWSGGERQRLRLAVQLGLSNLILHRKGIHTNLQVLDEPTSWLSVEGVESLLETLEIWAETNNRTVWLLDHRVLGRGGFSSRWSITLTEAGSVVERVD